jgi:dephospho-CoA kinase
VLTLRKVAITGGLASGKTTVCKVFRKQKAYVVDSDAIVHKLLSPDTQAGLQVVRLLGSNILIDGKIDRKKIALLVFSNPDKLHALEAILHPAVKKEIESEYSRVKDDPSYTFFVAEVPLLYETQMEKMFDTVIAVIADPVVAKNRFPSGEKEYLLRMERQDRMESKAQKADFTIVNNGDLASLEKATLNIIKKLGVVE